MCSEPGAEDRDERNSGPAPSQLPYSGQGGGEAGEIHTNNYKIELSSTA